MLFHTSDNFRDLLKADNFYFLKYRKYCAGLIPNMSKFTWQHVLDSELYCRQKYFFCCCWKNSFHTYFVEKRCMLLCGSSRGQHSNWHI